MAISCSSPAGALGGHALQQVVIPVTDALDSFLQPDARRETERFQPADIRDPLLAVTGPDLTGEGDGWLEAGSAGFNTGFAFPEVLMEMVAAARAADWDRARRIYTRFLPLIVFEQQPGVAVRKDILRRRGLLAGNTVRHPGAGLPPGASEQLDALIEATLPGVDLTKPLDRATL